MDDHQPAAYFEDTAARERSTVWNTLLTASWYTEILRRSIRLLYASKIFRRKRKKYLREELPHPSVYAVSAIFGPGDQGRRRKSASHCQKSLRFCDDEGNYRFVRDYSGIDNISEYCAAALRGDCGVQALLFIVLCRILGIPAKWDPVLMLSRATWTARLGYVLCPVHRMGVR